MLKIGDLVYLKQHTLYNRKPRFCGLVVSVINLPGDKRMYKVKWTATPRPASHFGPDLMLVSDL